MPISLELCVERELAARLKRAAFDAWRRDTALRNRVVGRWISWLQFNGYLLRALLRFWADAAVAGGTAAVPAPAAGEGGGTTSFNSAQSYADFVRTLR